MFWSSPNFGEENGLILSGGSFLLVFIIFWFLTPPVRKSCARYWWRLIPPNAQQRSAPLFAAPRRSFIKKVHMHPTIRHLRQWSYCLGSLKPSIDKMLWHNAVQISIKSAAMIQPVFTNNTDSELYIFAVSSDCWIIDSLFSRLQTDARRKREEH